MEINVEGHLPYVSDLVNMSELLDLFVIISSGKEKIGKKCLEYLPCIEYNKIPT